MGHKSKLMTIREGLMVPEGLAAEEFRGRREGGERGGVVGVPSRLKE